MPSIGFDFLPGDCLVKYVADQRPNATHLVTAVNMFGSSIVGSISAGTAHSLLDILAHIGSVVRRDGQLAGIPFGTQARRFQFPSGEHLAMPIPWGDLEMAYRTTGVANMTSYIVLPPSLIRLSQLTGELLIYLLHIHAFRSAISTLVTRLITGPSQAVRGSGRSYVYAQAQNANSAQRQAWLETIECYQFTAAASIPVVERVLAESYRGALTPALAFGADFVLNIAGTLRYDHL